MKHTITQRQKETIITDASLGKQAIKKISSELDYWARPIYYTPPKENHAFLLTCLA